MIYFKGFGMIVEYIIEIDMFFFLVIMLYLCIFNSINYILEDGNMFLKSGIVLNYVMFRKMIWEFFDNKKCLKIKIFRNVECFFFCCVINGFC